MDQHHTKHFKKLKKAEPKNKTQRVKSLMMEDSGEMNIKEGNIKQNSPSLNFK